MGDALCDPSFIEHRLQVKSSPALCCPSQDAKGSATTIEDSGWLTACGRYHGGHATAQMFSRLNLNSENRAHDTLARRAKGSWVAILTNKSNVYNS